MITPASSTIAVESSSSTWTTSAIGTGSINTGSIETDSIETGIEKSGLSTPSMALPSASSHALNSATQTPTSTHATNTRTPILSRSIDTSSQASTTDHQAGTTSLSSALLVPELFTGSSSVSTTSLPLPTTISGPTLDTRETHELVIDVGNCGDIGTPIVINDKGNRTELTSLGGGRFTMTISERTYYDTRFLAASMADDGGRCGQHAECPTVVIRLGDGTGIRMTISSSGESGHTMYPLSIWMDDGVTWDARPAHSSETASHCWGWTEEECPNSHNGRNLPLWTISSESSTARAFVTFCPPNGPDLSSVGENPSPARGPPRAWAVLPTTITVPVSTFISAASLEPPKVLPPAPTTYINLDVTSTVLLPTFVVEPANPVLTSWIVRSTNPTRSKVQSAWTFATLSPSSSGLRMMEPVLATVTDLVGSAVVTTIQPSSTPSTQDMLVDDLMANSSPSQKYIITSWTTWMTVDGSTVPAIAGQAAIETTVPVTYALESDTIIPVGALSSLSIESMRTASPSPTSEAARDEPGASKRGTIAAVVVGTIVGLALGSILVWFICYKRRRRARSGDYLAQGSLSWGESRDGGLLDLDGGTRGREVARETVMQPWVLPVSVTRRKEFESLGASGNGSSDAGGCGIAGPSREPRSGLAGSGPTSSQSRSQTQSEQHQLGLGVRSGKSAMSGPSGSQPQPQAQSLSHSRRSQPPGAGQVHHHDVTLSHLSESPPPISSEVAPPILSLLQRAENVEQYNAIPPLYNEEWSTTR